MGIEYLDEIEKNINRREISYNTNNSVVVSNDLIMHSASNLTLNELKLLRLIITQCRKGDDELYTFTLKAKDFAKLLDVDANDMRRNLKVMTRHIMQEVLEIEDMKSGDWLQFHWTDECRYKSGTVTIKISDSLKPYLLDLKGHFTRYKLEEILPFKSAHAFKIYELLVANIGVQRDNPHASDYSIVNVSMETLRLATKTTNKYDRYTNFNTRVLEPSIKEINQKSKYHVIAKPYRDNKKIVGIEFLIESQTGHDLRIKNDPLYISAKMKNNNDGQMNITDFM